jgi:hydrogenase nickel incorporation protein HypA/HybF
MHEYSLIRALLRQVREIARQHAATAVTEVAVSTGPLSGVEPLLLASAFEHLAADDMPGARLTIDEVPLIIACEECRRETSLMSIQFRCPGCGGGRTRVVGGEEVVLRHVALQMPAGEAVP